MASLQPLAGWGNKARNHHQTVCGCHVTRQLSVIVTYYCTNLLGVAESIQWTQLLPLQVAVSLVPRLSVPDFVSQLWRYFSKAARQNPLAVQIFLQSCKTKSGTESLGMRLVAVSLVPTVQFLITCSMQKWRGKAWNIYHVNDVSV